MIIGYARVSTQEQNLDRQLDNLKERGCERIYQEKMTGTKANRPELEKMLETLRKGDTLVIDSFSRLSSFNNLYGSVYGVCGIAFAQGS